MLKKYLGDIAFMQVLNLLVKPIWILVIDTAVQNALPQEVYGNYFALLNFSLLFFTILDLGLNSYNITEIASDHSKIVKLTGNILGLKVLLSGVYVAVIFVCARFMGYDSYEFGLLVILAAIQIFTSLNQYLRTIVASLQKFKWDGFFMVLDRVIIIAIVSFLLWGGIVGFELTIHRFAYAQLGGVLLVCIALLLFLLKYLNGIKISFSIKDLLPILRKSWPFALLTTLMGMYTYVDGVMLKSLDGNEEAAIYAQSYRLYYAFLMFAQIFSGVLLPFFSKNLVDKKIIQTIGFYTLQALLLIGVAAAFVGTAYGTEIMEFMYKEKSTPETVTAFKILMYGSIGSSLVLVSGTLLTAAKELKVLNTMAIITLLVNLVLNFKLIPVYGASGAAVATLVSQLIFGISCFVISIQKFGFKLNYKNNVLELLGIVLLYSVTIVGKQYFDSTLVHFIMITITILLVAYVFKLFRLKVLKSVTQK